MHEGSALPAPSARSRTAVLWWTGLIVFLPCVYVGSVLDPALVPRFFCLAVLALVVTGLFPFTGARLDAALANGPARVVFSLLLIYLASGALSLTAAIDLAEGIFDLSRSALMVSVLLVSTALLHGDTRAMSFLARLVTAVALGHALVGVLQYHEIAFTQLLTLDPLSSTMANKNLYAAFLFLSLPFQVYGALALSPRWSWLCIGSVLASVHVLTLSQCRSVWLAVWVGALAAGAVVWGSAFRARRRAGRRAMSGGAPGPNSASAHPAVPPVESVTVPGTKPGTARGALRGRDPAGAPDPAALPRQYRRRLAVCVGLGILVAAGTVASMRGTRVADLVLRRQAPISSARERWTLWNKTVQMIAEHPVRGVGAGNWKILLPKYGTAGLRSESGNTHFQRPHDDLLWVLAETGPGAAAAYVGVFVVLLVANVKAYRHPTSTPESRLRALLLLFGLVGYLVVATFSYPRERIELSAWVMVLGALTLAGEHRPIADHRRTGDPRHAGDKTTTADQRQLRDPGRTGRLGHVGNPGRAGAQQSMSPGGIAFRWKPACVRTGIRAGLWVVLLGCVALGYVRWRAERHTRLALEARDREHWLAVIREIDAASSPLADMDPTATPLAYYRGVAHYELGRIALARRDFAAAYALHPYHIHILNNLGTCYELQGDHQRALQYYHAALRVSPRFGDALLNMAAVYYGRAEYGKALQALQRVPEDERDDKFKRYLRVVERALQAGDQAPRGQGR